MDRPPRKTKVVNYCEAKDFDDDEDFTCVKAPPSKKAKEDVKQPEPKKSSSKSSSQEADSQSILSQKSRSPLDANLYERDLEAAITLSLLNNANGIKEHSLISKGDVKVQLPVDENTDPSSPHLSNCSVDSKILGLDEIASEKESCAPSRHRKSATKATEKRKKLMEEDEDYQPKQAPDSESDEDFSEPNESEDEEFTVKQVSKTKKDKATKNEKTKRPASKKEKQPSKPKSQTVSTPVRSPPTAKPAPRRPASTVSSSKSAVSLSPAGGRIPKWNPPGHIGKSPTSSQSPAVKSPGQGLRLGLSRLVRVKPLHPSVASH